MNTILKTSLLILLSLSCSAMAADVITPSKITKEEVGGKIFERPGMITEDSGALDVRTMLSSDRKFDTGMYKAGASRIEITEPYGLDEFMYFIKGSVKLTSSDGSVQTINAGEAVTISKEWTGIWETEGYEKIYVIYYPEALPE